MTAKPTATSGVDEEARPLVSPRALDHVNLHVRDVRRSLDFYRHVLGVTDHSVLDRDRDGTPTFVELSVGDQIVFLMRRADYEPPVDRHARGLNHFCLLIDPTDPDRLQADLRARGVTITGTRGNPHGSNFSVYIEDPDGHGIELEQRR